MTRSIVVVAVVLAGCRGGYVPPPAGAPHAVVEVRSELRSQPGDVARIDVSVDGVPLRGATRATRVRPGDVTIAVHSSFYDEVLVPDVEWRTVTRRRRCTMRDDDGTRRRGTCEVDTQVASPTTRVVRVDRGGCIGTVSFRARAGAEYLVGYAFDEPRACRAVCVRRDARGREHACDEVVR